jgi:membrane associated rhomboid family serine protease
MDRRDRLLAALLAERPSLVVLRWDADLSILLDTQELRRLLLVTMPEDAGADAQRDALATQVKLMSQGGAPTHLIAVGGGPEVAALLKEVAPFVQTVPMGFHQLDRAGQLLHVSGKALSFLAPAVGRIDMEAPVDPAPIAAAIHRGQALAQEERTVVARLSGRHQVTVALVAACAALFALAYHWGGGDVDFALRRMGADRGELVKAGELWRLFASAFLHWDVAHLLANMVALWSFGPMIEAVLGARRYVVLYGTSALAGSLASALLRPERWSAGASGAIWGLMAAGFALALRPKGILPSLMAQNLRGRLMGLLVLNVLISFQGGVDMLAHFGGGAVGFVLTATVLTDGLVPLDQRATPAQAERRPSLFTGAASALTAAAMVASVAMALVTGKPWELAQPPALARVPIGDSGLSIEVPAGMQSKRDQGHDVTIWSFGSLMEAPVAFEAIVSEASGNEADPFGEAQKELDQRAPDKWTRTAAARRITLGGQPAVVVEHDVGKVVHVKTFFLQRGSHEVLLRGYAARDRRPAAWKDMEEKVAASIAER